jgi:hypothetical protein
MEKSLKFSRSREFMGGGFERGFWFGEKGDCGFGEVEEVEILWKS